MANFHHIYHSNRSQSYRVIHRMYSYQQTYVTTNPKDTLSVTTDCSYTREQHQLAPLLPMRHGPTRSSTSSTHPIQEAATIRPSSSNVVHPLPSKSRVPFFRPLSTNLPYVALPMCVDITYHPTSIHPCLCSQMSLKVPVARFNLAQAVLHVPTAPQSAEVLLYLLRTVFDGSRCPKLHPQVCDELPDVKFHLLAV
jgi:hypothetical protein